jgi:hypothetical protein
MDAFPPWPCRVLLCAAAEAGAPKILPEICADGGTFYFAASRAKENSSNTADIIYLTSHQDIGIGHVETSKNWD